MIPFFGFKNHMTNKHFRAVFALVLIIALFSCRSFDEPSVKKSMTKPKASGNIYFSISGRDSVFYLDADNRKFKALPMRFAQLWDFDVSKDGNWLLVAYGTHIDRYNLLKLRKDYSRQVSFPPYGKITVGRYGRVIIYETQYQARRQLAVLYIETGENFILTSVGQGAAFDPLLAPSGQEYAWTQYDGFYFTRLNQNKPVQIASAPIIAEDFSPSGTYLTAGGQIYDVRALSPYPGKHGGHLRFIDDYFLIQQKPVDCDSLQKINISGTSRTFLFRTGTPILNFVVGSGQRFVVSVSAAADTQDFLFYVYDFVDLQKEFSIHFPRTRQSKLNKLVWPLRPSSLTQHD